MAGIEWIVALVVLAMLAKGGSSPKPGPKPPPPGVLGQGRPMAHSWTGNAQGWALSRQDAAKRALQPLADARPDLDLDEIAVSVVAHWAIETAYGASEYNFNVGGIHAITGQAYFDSTDAGVPTKFAAYDSIDDGAHAYGDLIANRYKTAALQLIADPTSPDWYVTLGQLGYFHAPAGTDVGAVYSTTRAKVAQLVAIKAQGG
jgi:hypothetical protein